MPGTAVTINQDQLLITLGQVQTSVRDKNGILRVIGELMRASIARTFRDEGSPAGSWPALAASTLKKKGYTAGHKLLIMSGRLFNSIGYQVSGGVLTVGTNVAYAAVHQFGSADRSGGSVGAQARIAGRSVGVGMHDYSRLRDLYYTRREAIGRDGKKYMVPTPMTKGDHIAVDKNGRRRKVKAAFQGPKQLISGTVRGHDRFQNIPARPYLVFRPEDPARFVSGIDAYIASRAPAVHP